MHDVMRALYDNSCADGSRRSEKHRQASKAYGQILDKIMKGFDWDFVNELENTGAQLREEGSFSSFRSGFRLGALIMLELLHEPRLPERDAQATGISPRSP